MEFLPSLSHPSEIWALFKFKFLGGNRIVSPHLTPAETGSADLMKCYQYLDQTSRSFAAVIRAIRDDGLRPAVAVFYLVLRALDTVEDDMSLEREEKADLLRHFHSFLLKPEWSYQKSRDKDRIVLQDFPTISRAFRDLPVHYQRVIKETAEIMGTGFAVSLDKPVESLADWDRYCYFAAGVVGVGLSRLFSAGEEISKYSRELSVAMGRFLQKTNITRDFLDDMTQGRQFWPEEIWRQYAGALTEFRSENNAPKSVSCLNQLITLTLEEAPDVIEFLEQLMEPAVFNFCAIPQVMAVATLLLCYDNKYVFQKAVKLRKGETVSLIQEATSVQNVKHIFLRYARQIRAKVRTSDPSRQHTMRACDVIIEKCGGNNEVPEHGIRRYLMGTGVILLIALSIRFRLHSWVLSGIQAAYK